MSFDNLRIIADEIHFEGELVAIMTTNATCTLRGRFEDLLLEAQDPPTKDEETGKPSTDAHPLDALAERAGEIAKGGLLRMSDLVRIVAQLKEPA